jgi:microcystin-dependent protein
MDYVNAPDPGTAYDFHTNTTTLPPWMLACTVSPYLLKDGSTYNVSSYPALGQYLGSTYGGNGVTTFGVPDERSRMRIPVATGVDPSRVTQAISGINGTTFGSSGGLQAVTLATANVPLFNITVTSNSNNIAYGGSSQPATGGPAAAIFNLSSVVSTGTLGTTTPSTVNNMSPGIVSFLALIKT